MSQFAGRLRARAVLPLEQGTQPLGHRLVGNLAVERAQHVFTVAFAVEEGADAPIG